MTLSPSFNYRPALVFLVSAVALLLIERLVVLLPGFTAQPAVPAAVTFDLIVGIPALFYWQVIRRYQLPVVSLVAAFAGALALGYLLIPSSHQQYLDWASQAMVLAEALLVVLALINLRRIMRAYRVEAQGSDDFLENLTAAFRTVLGRSFGPLVFEVALLRYAIGGWGAKVECQIGQSAFSSHRNSGFTALIATACLLSMIETVAVHLLVHRWSSNVAGLVLVLDLYTLVFLLAHLHAVRLRPTILTAEHLLVRVGFVWRMHIARQNVAAIQRISDAPATSPALLNVAKQLVTVPNLLVTFLEPVSVLGLYGIHRTVRHVALYVDEPTALIQALIRPNDPSQSQGGFSCSGKL